MVDVSDSCTVTAAVSIGDPMEIDEASTAASTMTESKTTDVDVKCASVADVRKHVREAGQNEKQWWRYWREVHGIRRCSNTTSCGVYLSRDTNASINILRRAQDSVTAAFGHTRNNNDSLRDPIPGTTFCVELAK